MRIVSFIRRAYLLALKTGVVASGLLSVWLIGGIAEFPGLWWLYAIASFGSVCGGCLLLDAMRDAEKLIAIQQARRSVPVPKIERYSSRRAVR